MNIEEFLDKSSPEEIIRRIARLASDQRRTAVSKLCQFLTIKMHYYSESAPGSFELTPFLAVSRLACRGLLQKGPLGVQVLRDIFLETPLELESDIDIGVILESLWHTSHGRLLPIFGNSEFKLAPPLDTELTRETIDGARQAFFEIVAESQLSETLFHKLLIFVFEQFISTIYPGGLQLDSIRSAIFDAFTEPAIKITRRLIDAFETLINEEHSEEVYQQFLAKHPVFIDPLASKVIPKQKLGLEHITDYVVRRLDNEYILVEIEKPQDLIFTANTDFTAKFTHAYGQVLDFQQWVDSNNDYACTLMPRISSPRGLLIIGLRTHLTSKQISKLKRFCVNSRSIDILTFDDLVARAKDLYANIHSTTEPDSLFQSDS